MKTWNVRYAVRLTTLSGLVHIAYFASEADQEAFIRDLVFCGYQPLKAESLIFESEEIREPRCIQCLRREAVEHNGGLCAVCAPPLRQ